MECLDAIVYVKFLLKNKVTWDLFRLKSLEHLSLVME
jgi:hypothetical protein